MGDATSVTEGASVSEVASTPFPLLETMKEAATVLRKSGLPFALAGGAAAYARGAAPPLHDVDFVILEADAEAVARAFEASGRRVERPPESWLIKAFEEDGRMIDLIFRLAGAPVTPELLGRADELDVAAVPMPVLNATDLVISWLASFSEHHADFAGTLTSVRPLREQVDWDQVRAATGDSAFAHAFLVLLERLRIVGTEDGDDR